MEILQEPQNVELNERERRVQVNLASRRNPYVGLEQYFFGSNSEAKLNKITDLIINTFINIFSTKDTVEMETNYIFLMQEVLFYKLIFIFIFHKNFLFTKSRIVELINNFGVIDKEFTYERVANIISKTYREQVELEKKLISTDQQVLLHVYGTSHLESCLLIANHERKVLTYLLDDFLQNAFQLNFNFFENNKSLMMNNEVSKNISLLNEYIKLFRKAKNE